MDSFGAFQFSFFFCGDPSERTSAPIRSQCTEYGVLVYVSKCPDFPYPLSGENRRFGGLFTNLSETNLKCCGEQLSLPIVKRGRGRPGLRLIGATWQTLRVVFYIDVEIAQSKRLAAPFPSTRGSRLGASLYGRSRHLCILARCKADKSRRLPFGDSSRCVT